MATRVGRISSAYVAAAALGEVLAAPSRPLDVRASLPRGGRPPAGDGWVPYRYLSYRMRRRLHWMPAGTFSDAMAGAVRRLEAGDHLQAVRSAGRLRWVRAIPGAACGARRRPSRHCCLDCYLATPAGLCAGCRGPLGAHR